MSRNYVFCFLLGIHFAVPFMSTKTTFPGFRPSFEYSNRFSVAKQEQDECSKFHCFSKHVRNRLLYSVGTSTGLNEEAGVEKNGSTSTRMYDHVSFQDLGLSIGANSAQLLRLSSPISSKERGVYTNESIAKGDIVLSIPLSSCIRDDMPPNWCKNFCLTSQTIFGITDEDDSYHNNPSEWTMRLAASLLDFQLNNSIINECAEKNEIESKLVARKQWLSMMPDPEYLRATLPIHWPERVVSKAKCVALELSIDSAFFSREEIVESLLSGMKQSGQFDKLFAKNTGELRTRCHDMLDLVQTRVCRVEVPDGVKVYQSLRILAPMFDFINHASSLYEGKGSANAYFGLEGLSEGSLREKDNLDDNGMLVVRACRDIQKDEEVLIDYGNSARPGWRCLTSYGFLPSDTKDVLGGEEHEYVAELFMDGTRYEIGRDIVPLEMVESANALLYEEKQALSVDQEVIPIFRHLDYVHDNDVLSPEVAIWIAQKATDAAFQLCIEANVETQGKSDNYEDAMKDDIFERISSKLATNLCRSQHQVLLACAASLQDYSAQ